MKRTDAAKLKRHQIIVDLWTKGKNGPQIAEVIGYTHPNPVYHHINGKCRCIERAENGPWAAPSWMSTTEYETEIPRTHGHHRSIASTQKGRKAASWLRLSRGQQ